MIFTSLYLAISLMSCTDDRSAAGHYAQIAEKFHIQIQEAEGPDSYRLTKPSAKLAWASATSRIRENYARMLRRQLNRYPVRLVERSGLKKIVVCSDLAINGRLVKGFAHDGTLWLNANLKRLFESKNPQNPADSFLMNANTLNYINQELTIHSEFFRMLDTKLFADSISSPAAMTAWEGVGGKNTYLWNWQGGKTLRSPEAFDPKNAGFISEYAQTSVWDDRAETFAHSILLDRRVARLAAQDAILCEKVALLKSQLRAICPEVDDDFWVNHNAFDDKFNQ